MKQEINFEEILDKNNLFAVAGASRNESKYGFKVLKKLKDNEYKVYPVNPNANEIYGLNVLPTLSDIEETVDVVSVVTPPHISKEIALEANRLGIKNIWFQPGAYNSEVLEALKDKDVNVIAGPCILIEIDAIKN